MAESSPLWYLFVGKKKNVVLFRFVHCTVKLVSNDRERLLYEAVNTIINLEEVMCNNVWTSLRLS